MEQHPVPQQISSYQFRLVGDMTLKQFFQVGGGALVSLLIYSTGIHPVVKWPLILFSFSLGAALAFLPFQERPLSIWILSFFRSVYSPTIYTWKKYDKPPVFFQEEAKPPEEKITAPHGEVALENYLNVRPDQMNEPISKLEGNEFSFLSKITGLFSGAFDIKGKGERQTTSITSAPVPKKPEGVAIPENTPISVVQKGVRPRIVVEEKAQAQSVVQKEEVKTQEVKPTFKESQTSSISAQFSPEAAPPLPPTIPNTVVGQIVDSKGKIIDGAIMEIRDLAGRPVRALRTNKVGHFIIVTSLANGQYDIAVEKDGFVFKTVTFQAKGEIIPPILIKAEEAAN